MKVVIDTNVFIAAFISPSGKSSVLLEHCATLHEIVCSELILDELREKLTDKFYRDLSAVADALDLWRTRLQVVSSLQLEESASRDSDDDVVLGTALAG